MTDRNTPSAPAEGLPPCLRWVAFDRRNVAMADREIPCPGDHQFMPKRFAVTWGKENGVVSAHPSHPTYTFPNPGVVGAMRTDDPDEAQAAFERGAEYVRTGVMP